MISLFLELPESLYHQLQALLEESKDSQDETLTKAITDYLARHTS